MRPRRAQTPLLIRSDKAAAIVARHTRPGYSQARIIEEALEEKYPDKAAIPNIDERRRRLEAILDKVDPSTVLTMKEFDVLEYDEFGLPR